MVLLTQQCNIASFGKHWSHGSQISDIWNDLCGFKMSYPLFEKQFPLIFDLIKTVYQ